MQPVDTIIEIHINTQCNCAIQGDSIIGHLKKIIYKIHKKYIQFHFYLSVILKFQENINYFSQLYPSKNPKNNI